MIVRPPQREPIRPSWAQVMMIAAIGPLLLAGMMYWLLGQGLHGNATRAKIQSSLEYQRQIDQLISLMKDAETGQRGYLISGQQSFLQPYSQARAHLDAQLTGVERLTPQQGPGAADMRQLKDLIHTKFTEMQSIIELRDRKGLAPAAARLSEGMGKRQMDHIRLVIARMDRRGAAELAEANHAEDTRRRENIRIIWGTIALIGIAAGILGFMIGRSRRLQYHYARQREDAAARQRAIFDAATDAIILINPSGSIETINPAAERMFAYTADDLLRRDISTLIDIAPGDGPFLQRLGLIDGKLVKPERIDVSGRDSQGAEVSVDIVLGTMPLPDGIHIVAALRDATTRREIERLKDDFISTVSHELRTPLTSVVGSLGLLRSGAAGPLPDAAQRLAEIAETNSQRLIRLINDILDIDQIRKGRMAFDYAVIDLRDVMTRTLDAMQGLAVRRGIVIDMRMPAEPVMACADAERLIQVAGNLLSNAIKFSSEGSTVAFELIGGEDHVIQITDSGPGIDPEFAKTIFNRFAQGARSSGQTIAGTGLGLAISREIVRSHGGEISFENREEGGARFAFSVPRDTAHGAAGHRGSGRLLICEGDGDAGRTIQSILTAHGYASDLVTTVRDAVAHARSHHYDVALLDLTLADADGMDVIRALKVDPETRRLPVIVISGTTPSPDVDSEAYAGWLMKPFDPPRLIQLVQRAIRRSDQRKAMILHIDDDDDSRELFAAALAGRGLLFGATSLASARAILEERRPDAIVLDLGLPDGSGHSLLADIKGWEKPLPVIVYSAQEIGEDVRQLADAVLVKSRRALPKLTTTVLDIVDRQGGPQ